MFDREKLLPYQKDILKVVEEQPEVRLNYKSRIGKYEYMKAVASLYKIFGKIHNENSHNL